MRERIRLLRGSLAHKLKSIAVNRSGSQGSQGAAAGAGCGPENERVVWVRSVENIPEGRQDLVEISTSGAMLTTTCTHRYMVRRGDRTVAAPATSLRKGDDILVCNRMGCEEFHQVKGIDRFVQDVKVLMIEFMPDVAVHTMYAEAILTRGHRRARRHHRASGVVTDENIDENEGSMPVTYNETLWF